jgi:phage-related protein
VKLVEFLGDSLARLREFPKGARRSAGYQLERVQRGLEPDDWKPMKAVGPGVRELRIRDRSGGFRVIYLATLADRIAVLHAFRKKTQRTAKPDIEAAAKRFRELWKDR